MISNTIQDFDFQKHKYQKINYTKVINLCNTTNVFIEKKYTNKAFLAK